MERVLPPDPHLRRPPPPDLPDRRRARRPARGPPRELTSTWLCQLARPAASARARVADPDRGRFLDRRSRR